MKRREFITLFGGAAAAWPPAARAQQPDRIRRLGVLFAYVENDPEGQLGAAAFRQGAPDRGFGAPLPSQDYGKPHPALDGA
jgi:putative ABC transport system substrate-binding protein